MSIRVTLSCDGKEGVFDCRQATPCGEVRTAREAREIAKKVHGWSSFVYAPVGTEIMVLDFCQACTRRRAEGR